MTNLDVLLDRNRAFAATDARTRVPTIPFVPATQTYVLTCIDPRVDPAAVLGVGLGDTIVQRVVGGRAGPAVLRDLGWITHLHRTLTPDADWFDLVVVHHTDCGAGLYADDGLRHGFAETGGYDEVELATLAVTDPAATARADADLLLASPMVDEHVAVSGHVYDLATGLVTEVAAPRRRVDLPGPASA